MKQSKVGAIPPGCPTGDITLGHRSGKAVSMADHPIGEQAATAASGYAQFCRVDVAALDDLVDSQHQVAEIVAGIVILNDIAKLLAVAGAAPGVGIEHNIA